jgi:murein DD-endopeptidase MepM/ murein hydrolase activator NlpD
VAGAAFFPLDPAGGPAAAGTTSPAATPTDQTANQTTDQTINRTATPPARRTAAGQTADGRDGQTSRPGQNGRTPDTKHTESGTPQTATPPPQAVALLGVPSTVRPGPALVRCEAGDTLIGELALTIGERAFTAEEIPLNQSNTDLRTLPDPQKTREAEQLWAILGRTGGTIYGADPFVPPVQSTRRTGFFGDRRVFIYTDGSRDTAIHAGVDYGIPRGTVVGACGAGKVALARSRIVTGNSVVIEHLPGVYSLYYHLDTIAVSEGQQISAGERIGTSGATGLATGPHLHWEIRVSGENTDPDAFLGRPVIDREAILSKLDL